ncbi:hypothetical protein F444_11974 [Phytophthora nicotianae P1976]|nr:hypothetical protein F444_11974 [Phytophthora nicotianae P1976]
MKNRNDWWLDGEESHTKDRTERTVKSGRQKDPSNWSSTCIQAGDAENLDGRRKQTYTEEAVYSDSSDKIAKIRKETTNQLPNHENGHDAQAMVFTLLATT